MERCLGWSDLLHVLTHLVDTADIAESVIAKHIDSSACLRGEHVRNGTLKVTVQSLEIDEPSTT